ncbi:Uncharacterised protein [Bordetella pertussis]|nr:Uncharacterised protein [Bordetella pertussis]
MPGREAVRTGSDMGTPWCGGAAHAADARSIRIVRPGISSLHRGDRATRPGCLHCPACGRIDDGHHYGPSS